MSKIMKNFICVIVLLLGIVSNYFTLDHMEVKNPNHQVDSPLVGEGSEKTGRQEGEPPQDMAPGGQPGEKMGESDSKKDTNPIYYFLIVSEVLVIAGSGVYLIMSKFNEKTLKETFKNADKVTIYILGTLLLTSITVSAELDYAKEFDNFRKDESVTEKDTKVDDIEKGETVDKFVIDLSQYDSNITLEKAGTYDISGKFDHMLLVDADGPVVLKLNGVEIENDISAAIVNKSSEDLIIDLVLGSKNILSDGGSSEYDACIYSNGHLFIDGDGELVVKGNQIEGEGIATENNDITIDGGNISIEAVDDGLNAGGDGGLITINGGNIFIKASGDGIDSNKDLKINGGTIYTMGSSKGGDAGIDTDAGFTIDGGTVIALGSDMLETPKAESKQNVLAFSMSNKIDKGTLVSLVKEDGYEVISFEAQEDFKTLIISSDKLTLGNYSLYTKGKHSGNKENFIYVDGTYTKGTLVEIGGKSEFKLEKNVTSIK